MNYLVNRLFSGSMVGYLESFWSEDMADRIQVLTYQDLRRIRHIPATTTIFTDHERFTPAQDEMARQLWDCLGAAGVRRLNHPRKVHRRPQLLELLHHRGLNTFRAVVATDSLHGLRYPVFVRQVEEHTGSLTRLLKTRKQLDWSLAMLTRLGGHRREDLLVVEFCDTSRPDGIYPKYSAFRVGDRILPRNLVFDSHWMVKDGGRGITVERAQEELDHNRRNPHARELMERFELAGIEYGRMDYSLLDGTIQVWEINTNPRPGPRPASKGGVPSDQLFDWAFRREAKELFFDQYLKALRVIDEPVSGEVAWEIDHELAHRLRAQDRQRLRRQRLTAGLARLRQTGPVRDTVRRIADRV